MIVAHMLATGVVMAMAMSTVTCMMTATPMTGTKSTCLAMALTEAALLGAVGASPGLTIAPSGHLRSPCSG